MSKPKIDVGIIELIASKICHDLISPIGAINNGLEILEEMGPDAGEDVTALLSFSSTQASAKLKAYRIAYGAGGSDSNITPSEVYNAIESLVSGDKKISQNWDPQNIDGFSDLPKGYCKVLTCALLLAKEALPKGGTLSVTTNDNQTLIKAEGPDANLSELTEQALSLNMNDEIRQPKFIHAWLSGLMAHHYGFKIEVSEKGDGHVCLNLALS